MKRSVSTIIFALLTLTLFGTISAKELAGENSINLAKSKIFAFKTVRGKFAESASRSGKANLLRFYKGDHSNKYKVTATIYRRTKGINTYTLPQPKNTWSIMEPMSVFFANADKDSDNEIIIIERNMTGIGPSGSRYFYRTRVYDWNGKKFRHLENVSKKIGTARTQARVKLILRNMLKVDKPAKFEKMNTAAFNRKIRDAARNREFWVKMPTLVASGFVGTFSETKKRTVEITSEFAEATTRLDVVIIDDGFAGDSVRGVKYKLKLQADSAGIWYITSAEKAQRCYKGRGHQDYSAAPCS